MEVLSIIMYGICIEMCANGCHIPHYISLHLERSDCAELAKKAGVDGVPRRHKLQAIASYIYVSIRIDIDTHLENSRSWPLYSNGAVCVERYNQ